MKKLKMSFCLFLICCMIPLGAFSKENVIDFQPAYSGNDILIGVPDAIMTQSKIFTDVNDEDLYNKLSLLNAIDVVTPDKDGHFNPDDLVSRIDAIKFILPAIKADINNYEATTSFYDVPQNTDDAKYVSFAKQNGIVRGYDEYTFKPNNNVSGIEFFAMLLNLMGYNKVSDEMGGYVAGLYKIANSIEMNVDEYLSKETITRADAASMLYEALNTPVIGLMSVRNSEIGYSVDSDNKKMLEVYFDVFAEKGQVTATPVTSINGGNVSFDKMTVDNMQYYCDRIKYNSFLGYDVKYFYKKTVDDELGTVICMWKTGKTDEILLDSENSPKYDGGVLSYYIENRKNSVNIDPINIVIKNGKRLFENYDSSIFEIKSGTLKLLSPKGNDKYNIIFIDEYINVVVESVSVDGPELIISPKYGLKPIKISMSDKKIICECSDLNGNQVSFESSKIDAYDADGNKKTTYVPPAIPSGCVLSIFADKTEKSGEYYIPSIDATYYRMIISQEKVDGTIEEIENNPIKYVINNVAYKIFENGFLNYEGAEIKIGDKSTFLLDFNGKIVATLKEIQSDFQYAYLINAACSNGVDEEISMKFLFSDNQIKVINGNKSIKVNGKKYTDGKEVLEVIKQSAKYANGDTQSGINRKLSQVVKVKLDSDENVKELETLISRQPLSSDDNRISLDVVETEFSAKEGQNLTLYQGGGYNKYGAGPRYARPNVFFNVPLEYTGVDDDYSVISKWIPNEDKKVLDLYDVSEGGLIPKVAVIYAPVTPIDIDYLAVVSKVKQIIDKNGTEKKAVTICNGNETITYTEKVSGVFNGLKCGDVIHIYGNGTEASKVLKLYSIDSLPNIDSLPESDRIRYSESDPDKIGWLENINSAAQMFFFEPYKREGEYISIYRGPILSDGTAKRQLEKLLYWNPNKAAFSYGAVLYEENGGKNPEVRVANIYDIKLSSVYGNEGASKILFVETYGDLKQLVIFNRSKN